MYVIKLDTTDLTSIFKDELKYPYYLKLQDNFILTFLKNIVREYITDGDKEINSSKDYFEGYTLVPIKPYFVKVWLSNKNIGYGFISLVIDKDEILKHSNNYREFTLRNIYLGNETDTLKFPITPSNITNGISLPLPIISNFTISKTLSEILETTNIIDLFVIFESYEEFLDYNNVYLEFDVIENYSIVVRKFKYRVSTLLSFEPYELEFLNLNKKSKYTEVKNKHINYGEFIRKISVINKFIDEPIFLNYIREYIKQDKVESVLRSGFFTKKYQLLQFGKFYDDVNLSNGRFYLIENTHNWEIKNTFLNKIDVDTNLLLTK